MTGYGRGQCARGGMCVSVEVSSVNRRQNDVTVLLPRELDFLEPRIREMVGERVSRGKVTVRVSVEVSEKVLATSVRFNQSLAKTYVRDLRDLARELGLPQPVTLDCIANLPGVIELLPVGHDPEKTWPLVRVALARALDALIAMRSKEGAHLTRDLAARLRRLKRLTRKIADRAPKVVPKYKEALLSRIRAAGIESINPNDERLLKEVVIFADRCDISEELTRLQSHFNQCDECLRSSAAEGRKLEFLAQEMLREINTIGSKANDALISRAVVEFKTELERFREQVQNVE